MSDPINLVVGDTRPPITFTLRDRNTAAAGAVLRANDPTTWAPVNLTGASVKFHMRAAGSSTLKQTIDCVVTEPVQGKVMLTFPVGALDTPGTFEGEIEVTYADTGIQTVYDFVKLKVRGAIA